MARRCDICGKGPQTGNAVSHANNHTRRTWIPNIQRLRVMVNGGVRRLNVCTQCLKSGRVQRAV